MKKLIPFIALAVIVAAQLGVPASMIIRYENARVNGTELKFRTGLRDPYDPFRGRYVALNFELDRLETPIKVDSIDSDSKTSTYHDQQLYVLFGSDAQGFATIESISTDKPHSGTYLRMNLWARAGTVSNLNLPFDEYYMNEKAAPAAERIYRDSMVAARNNRQADDPGWSNDNYARVRILDGTAVTTGLIVDGQPIEQLVAAQQSDP